MFLREDTFSKNKQANTRYTQIDSSKIDDNVEFVHSQYSILTSQVSIQYLCPTKLLINSDHFRIKCLSCSKVSSI